MKRFVIPREGYYSNLGYSLLAEDKDLGIEVWGDDTSAMAFHGKAQKPDWHYRFRSIESRDQRIADYVSSHRKHAERKADARKEKAEWQHGIKVGDVFSTSWGYDQTNVEFFEVTKVMGKAIEIREIAQDRESSGWEQGSCVPLTGRYITEPRKMIPQRGYNGEPSLSIYSFASASPFRPVAVVAGKPIFQECHWTAYA